MYIKDYFIKALQNGLYKKKIWVIEIFSYCDYTIFEEVEESSLYDYQLVKKKDNTKQLYAVIPHDDGRKLELLEDYVDAKPVCRLDAPLTLKVGDLVNVSKEVLTTYGNAFINSYILIYPFGNKFDFVTGSVSTRDIEKQIASLLTDTPGDGQPRLDTLIYVDEYLKYGEAMQSLEGFSMLCVQAASASTMSSNLAVIKKRNELFEQYKDKLDDPAVIALIQKQISDLDRELLKDDISNKFYMTDKSFDVVRMKKFSTYGLEGGFGDNNSAKLIKNSLEEGWKPEFIPSIADSARSGSYARGKETALGGATVKDFYRIFQNVKVVEDDCGTKLGFTDTLKAPNKDRYIGLNYLDVNNKTIEITKETIDGLIDSKIKLRTPMLCITKAPNFCKKCVGHALASKPEAMHIVTSDIGSAFLSARMAAVHGKSLRTVAFDINVAIA